MQTTVLYAKLNLNTSVPLERCSGERYEDGEFIACNSGCIAHFDVNHETEYGEFYNPYPNSILSWIRLLPGTASADELIPIDPEKGIRPGWITAHRNDDMFLGADGLPLTLWVVSLNAAQPDSHFAALFRNPKKAEELVAEILGQDD